MLGAYWTGTGHDGGWSTDSPSRTAVDDEGNVVIANRGGDWEDGGDSTSSITKVAADPASCPDTNGNGVVALLPPTRKESRSGPRRPEPRLCVNSPHIR